jgi:hypothetical protein
MGQGASFPAIFPIKRVTKLVHRRPLHLVSQFLPDEKLITPKTIDTHR